VIHNGISRRKKNSLDRSPQKLLDYCYSTLPADGSLILIKRGEAGYHFSSKDAGSREANEQLAEKLNDALCITFSQEKAMNIGATLGWDNIGADPAM